MTEEERINFIILFFVGTTLGALGAAGYLAIKLDDSKEKNRIYRAKISGLVNAFGKFIDHTVAVDDQDELLQDMKDEFDLADRFIREGL